MDFTTFKQKMCSQITALKRRARTSKVITGVSAGVPIAGSGTFHLHVGDHLKVKCTGLSGGGT